MLERVKPVAEGEPYPQHLGIKLVESAQVRAVLCLPYRACLGLDRMHRGATVCFSINFLRKATALDLIATATVRPRGRKILHLLRYFISNGKEIGQPILRLLVQGV